MANAVDWGERPEFSWYRAAGEQKTHYWIGARTLCGRWWSGWKWREGTNNKCLICVEFNDSNYTGLKKIEKYKKRMIRVRGRLMRMYTNEHDPSKPTWFYLSPTEHDKQTWEKG
jgi:hypothetical protein